MPIILIWLFGWLSRPDERLKSSIDIYRAELELCAGKVKSTDGSSPPDVQAAADKASELLEQAEEALGKNNVELGWRLFKGAHRIGFFCLTNEQLRMQAIAIYEEAQKKLDSWRKEAIDSMLADDSGKLKPCLNVPDVFHAAYILDEYHNNVYHKLGAFKRQLAFLSSAGLGIAIAWIVLSALTIDASNEINDPLLLVLVMLFGALGAVISGFLPLSNGLAGHRIPEQLASYRIVFARLAIGSVSALVIYVFLSSGILELGDLTTGKFLAVSFVAGFSERLVVRAVEAVNK
jgi:hypothetical protein